MRIVGGIYTNLLLNFVQFSNFVCFLFIFCFCAFFKDYYQHNLPFDLWMLVSHLIVVSSRGYCNIADIQGVHKIIEPSI